MIAPLGIERVVLARELSLREIRADRGGDADAAGGVRPRRAVRRLQRPVPHERVARRPQRQPRPVRPGVPARLRADLRRRGPRPRRREVPAQPAGSRGDRARAGARRGRRRVAQDRRPAQDAGVRGGDRRATTARRSTRRCAASRCALAADDAARDGADVLARPVARLARRATTTSGSCRACRARSAACCVGRGARRAAAIGCRSSSTSRWPRATASCSRATAPAATKPAAACTRCFASGEPPSGREQGRVELLLPPGVLDDADVWRGQQIWQTDDPQLTQAAAGDVHARRPRCGAWPIDVTVVARRSASRSTRARDVRRRRRASRSTSEHVREAARKHPASEALLARAVLLASAARRTSCGKLQAEIVGAPMVPLSVLGELRHRLVAALDAARTAPPRRESRRGVAERMLADAASRGMPSARRGLEADMPLGASTATPSRRPWRHPRERARPRSHVLCRSLEQLARRARGRRRRTSTPTSTTSATTAPPSPRRTRAGATIYLASLRIHKPGEDGLFVALAKHAADGWLVRNLAALAAARERGIPAVADFSLNAANPLTVEWLRAQGAERVTASYDLNRDQLLELVDAAPPAAARGRHPPAHADVPHGALRVLRGALAGHATRRDCGRPCDRHAVQLRDRVGAEHVLHADIGCRNTLYNAHGPERRRGRAAARGHGRAALPRRAAGRRAARAKRGG